MAVVQRDDRGEKMKIEEASALCEVRGSDDATAEALTTLFPKEISEYTKEDFLDGDEPYEYIYLYRHDKYKQSKLLKKMSDHAKSVKVSNFTALYKAFLSTKSEAEDDIGGMTNFPDQPLELHCGSWICDAGGVRKLGDRGTVFACPHPIMPVARLCNIDTGIEKIKVAYRRGRQWKYAIFDRKTLSTANKITDLADVGIAVTSETAKALVGYFYDVEMLNPDILPETECVTRLGWISRGDGKEFAPYAEGLVFDGEAEYRKKYESVAIKGNFDKWVDCICKNIRRNNVIARVTFAASLASALAKPLGCNCFWLHLWGETESAKTVLAMCAASIWGNPEIGSYITTFNSTYVGMEKAAAFFNSLPYIVDELQIVDSRKDMDNLIYMITEGCGRTRGNKSGGLENVSEWKNCTITTGERPINTQKSGGGSVNRVIEVECKEKFFGSPDKPQFDEPRDIANCVKANYGLLGRGFVVELLSNGYMERAEGIFKGYSDRLTNEYNITQKQAQSAALILTADHIVTDFLFGDGRQLTCEEIVEFLKTKDEVSIAPRAYEFVSEYVAMNQQKFGAGDTNTTETWGELVDGGNSVYIIKTQFDRICAEGGYNPQALLSWLSDRKLIRRTDSKHMTVTKRIGNAVVRCIHMTLLSDESTEEYPEF